MISVIIPIVRPKKAARCIAALADNSIDFEVISEVDHNHIGCPEMVKKLAERAKYDWVMFLGDDTIPEPNMLDHAAEYIDDWVLMVGLNDGIHGDGLSTHWMVHKDILKHTGGEFFCTEYSHCFCDKELADIAKENNGFVFAHKAKFKHDHPSVTGAEYDSHYKRAYSEDVFKKDMATYRRRKRERLSEGGVRLAIGLPITDEKIHTQFFLSFITLDLPNDCFVLFPSIPVHQSDIGKIRNDLCEQALDKGCTHILMLDTDQVYHDSDLIFRLLNHRLDIVCGKVHRRYPPFEPILNRGRFHIDDAEIEEGGLIEVDATGTGCMLLNLEVLDNVEHPWFELSMNEEGKPVGEDIGFCYKAKDAGYRVFVDCGVEIGHLALIQVGGSLYQLWKKIKEVRK